MKNTLKKLLTIAAFGLFLNSSVMAGEHSYASTPDYQSYNATSTDVNINKTSYKSYYANNNSQSNILSMDYDSTE
ncbi:MAG: hypothetical protein KAG34_04665 [Cocleimonas sp.]|nr:hypothetical protein [Cocleimonas sp.]